VHHHGAPITPIIEQVAQSGGTALSKLLQLRQVNFRLPYGAKCTIEQGLDNLALR
jgi:hypothetical protein